MLIAILPTHRQLFKFHDFPLTRSGRCCQGKQNGARNDLWAFNNGPISSSTLFY